MAHPVPLPTGLSASAGLSSSAPSPSPWQPDLVDLASPRLAFNNDYRVFFSADNPELLAFEKLQRTYTKIDNILFAIAPREGSVFTPQILDAIESLTLNAWQLPFVLRVDSMANFQHTVATDDDLVVADLVEGGRDFDAPKLLEVAKTATNEPSLRDFLVAHEGHTTGVNVTFQMPQKAMDEVPQAVAAAREHGF